MVLKISNKSTTMLCYSVIIIVIIVIIQRPSI